MRTTINITVPITEHYQLLKYPGEIYRSLHLLTQEDIRNLKKMIQVGRQDDDLSNMDLINLRRLKEDIERWENENRGK